MEGRTLSRRERLLTVVLLNVLTWSMLAAVAIAKGKGC